MAVATAHLHLMRHTAASRWLDAGGSEQGLLRRAHPAGAGRADAALVAEARGWCPVHYARWWRCAETRR
ncbi:hypothetical protein [Mycobacterium sp.]|uniref:hypothetical protein n=1 Tax=Mycobacterium sp. TaxID=1785 RepID=UPI003C7925C8